MSLREIIKVPNPFLKVIAKPVTVIDEDILTILDDMMETMYHANGIGLAATQIAIDKRLIVMDCGKTKYETQNISEEEYNEKIKISWNNKNESFDYIVIADGVFSKLKSQISNNHLKPIFNGNIALRANLKQHEKDNISVYYSYS